MKLLHLAIATFGITSGEINIPNASANDVLSGILNTIYVTAGIVAVVAIVIGGFRYVVSQGDATSVEKAKNTILYAVIGLIVIAAAFAVTWFVIGRF